MPSDSVLAASSTDEPADAAAVASFSPEELAVALRVIDAVADLDAEHPDYIALRRATGKMYKDVKRLGRLAKRARIAAADRAVVAATATGAPDRIDDEIREAVKDIRPHPLDLAAEIARYGADTRGGVGVSIPV